MGSRPLASLKLPLAPPVAARQARLRYTDDQRPGIERQRRGKGFRYVAPSGRAIRDPDQIMRLQRLAIPPAWREVWISPDPHGHLQATGRDARGRKQYRYHRRWRQLRDETKYHRMIAFGRVLPAIRARVERDLARPGLPREKVLATIVRLLETTLIRVGNEEYARHNRSFGLTTLRDRHARIRGATLRFEFRGKHGIDHSVDLHDRRLARIVQRCRDIPGQDLFQYLDDAGVRHAIGSGDVNAYLREISGDDFTAKDFRTWAGTVLVARALRELPPSDSQRKAKRNVSRAIEAVALLLGNTPSVCRNSYVHPAVIENYLAGRLIDSLRRRAKPSRTRRGALRPEEEAVLAFLQRELGRGRG
jgi:DNA topoisomerase-1